MYAVLITAVVTYVMMLIFNLDFVEIGGTLQFLVEGLIAVVIGAAAGLIGAWYLSRQRRKERRS
jgi:multisubunit Na+/H+ antiporter MnhB subunit